MVQLHCSGSSILSDIVRSQAQHIGLPPSFLIPAFAHAQRSSFSTTTAVQARKDGNPRRGMSALKKSGLGKRFRLSVKYEDLPKPVLDPKQRTQIETDPNHGLWGFFDTQRSALMTPEALSRHGRAWTTAELRKKDYADLCRLHWVCAKEINRINTYERERKRLKIGFGEDEAEKRRDEALMTQTRIKHTLIERWYHFEDARNLAMEDAEIDLFATDDRAYTPARDPERDYDDVDDGSDYKQILLKESATQTGATSDAGALRSAPMAAAEARV